MSNRIGVKSVFGATGEQNLGEKHVEPEDWGKVALARRKTRLLAKEPQDTCQAGLG